jgi:hypothetical protein
MIGNRDPVRVAADVVHHLLGSGEGRLGLNDPFRVAHRIEMPAENLRISKGLEGREEVEFAGVESRLQALAAMGKTDEALRYAALETLAYWVENRDGTVAAFGSFSSSGRPDSDGTRWVPCRPRL